LRFGLSFGRTNSGVVFSGLSVGRVKCGTLLLRAELGLDRAERRKVECGMLLVRAELSLDRAESGQG
jgi:hypothetical protein